MMEWLKRRRGWIAFILPLARAALLLISPRDKNYAAIDGVVLLIAMLALSPMTSRYHFVLVLPAVMRQSLQTEAIAL